MAIIRISAIFFFTLIIASCGSSEPDSTEIIFPEHLPQENPGLSQDTRSGIWMVYRSKDISYIGYEDGIKYEMSLQSTENGISVLKSYNFETSTLPFCTIGEMFEQFELNIIPTESGYNQSYSKYANNNVPPNSHGSLEITFINNNKLVGKGNRKYTYTNGSRNELTTIYAVKVSDDTSLNSSTNLSYSSHVETESDLEVDIPAICIAVSSFDATHYRDEKKTSDNYVQSAQILGIGDHSPHGIDIFNTKGTSEEGEYQRIGGVYYDGQNYDWWRKNIFCPFEDTTCLTQNTLEFNIIQNDNAGISFNTRLNTSDGSFLNSEVSLILDPIINEE